MTEQTTVKQQDPAPYGACASDDDACIARALEILAGRMRKPGTAFESPKAARDFCRLKLGAYDREVFGVLFLDSQNRLIEFREMFFGTLSQAAVYPREVARAALALNAGAVIVTHNHPSGDATPSRADETLTSSLKSVLYALDVRLLDHVVVSATDAVSMAQVGML